MTLGADQEGHQLGDVPRRAEALERRLPGELVDRLLIFSLEEQVRRRRTGATALTVTSRPRSSRASTGVIASTAPLLAVYPA